MKHDKNSISELFEEIDNNNKSKPTREEIDKLFDVLESEGHTEIKQEDDPERDRKNNRVAKVRRRPEAQV